MAEICVVLVEPKHQCNVGFVARAMKNFNLSKLYFLGKPFVPGEKAYECAAHANNVLEKAVNLSNRGLGEVFDIVVGTTSKPHSKDSSPRKSIPPEELEKKLRSIKGSAALVFGREDIGLLNSELEKCDMVTSIPTGEVYPALNISHAAAILFYELSRNSEIRETRGASGKEKEALNNRLSLLLDSVGYPNYKKKVAERIFRKVIGRSGISGREAHTLAGIFKEADDRIKRLENI